MRKWFPGGESRRERGQRAHLPGKPSPRLLKEHTVIDIDPNTDGLPGIEQLRVIICGASVTLVNFFWNVGQSV